MQSIQYGPYTQWQTTFVRIRSCFVTIITGGKDSRETKGRLDQIFISYFGITFMHLHTRTHAQTHTQQHTSIQNSTSTHKSIQIYSRKHEHKRTHTRSYIHPHAYNIRYTYLCTLCVTPTCIYCTLNLHVYTVRYTNMHTLYFAPTSIHYVSPSCMLNASVRNT